MGHKSRKTGNQWSDVDGGQALVIPLSLFRHENFTRLTPHGLKLLMDLCRQYTGFNNGYLWAGWALLKDQGWNSKETLNNAILECEHYRLITRTKQGGKNKPNYHGLTWWRIHEIAKRPLDTFPSLAPSNDWKEQRPAFEKPLPKVKKQILSTVDGETCPARRASRG